jgi:hypothetical protein
MDRRRYVYDVFAVCCNHFLRLIRVELLAPSTVACSCLLILELGRNSLAVELGPVPMQSHTARDHQGDLVRHFNAL